MVRVCFSRIFLLLVICGLVTTSCRQKTATIDTPAESQIFLRMKLPQGDEVQLSCDPGTVFSIKINGQLYGFSIKNVGVKNEQVAVQVMRALHIDSSNMTITGSGIEILDKLELTVGKDSSQFIRTKAGFEIQSLESSIASRLAGGVSTGGNCCVTCGRTRACGCAVELDCGSCCAGQCCAGTGGRLPKFLL